MNLQEKYPKLTFLNNWELSPFTANKLNFVDGVVYCVRETILMPYYRHDLIRKSIIQGAHATASLEGNTLTLKEVERIYEQSLSKTPIKELQFQEVDNILVLYKKLIKNSIHGELYPKLDLDFFLELHKSICANVGSSIYATPGVFRTDNRQTLRYQNPDASDIPLLVEKYIQYIEESFLSDETSAKLENGILQAFCAHVYCFMISPFSDGNGRVGRMLEYYYLLRAGLPPFFAFIMPLYYHETKYQYYKTLEDVSISGDLAPFINYAIDGLYNGVKKAYKNIASAQSDMTWESFIYATFDLNADSFTRMDSMLRKRRLALLLPKGASFDADDVPHINDDLHKLYDPNSIRSLQRDMDDLLSLELLRMDEDGVSYIVNWPPMQKRKS